MKAINLFIIGVVFLSACGPKTILQTDTNNPIDLSGRWNITDAEIASNQIYNELLRSDWLKKFKSEKNYTPSIYIEGFTNDMDTQLYNEQIIEFFNQYFQESRQFNLITEDNTNIPYFILKGDLSSEDFEQNNQQGINYHLEVKLLNTEGSMVWSEDNFIKKFIKE